MIERANQPVANWRGVRIGLVARRWIHPVVMRQQEVETRRIERQQIIDHFHRIALRIDHRQKAREDRAIARRSHQLQPFFELRRAGVARVINAMAIVHFRRPVDAHSHRHAPGEHRLANLGRKQQTVRLHADFDFDIRGRQLLAKNRRDLPQMVGASQQRFAAMQNQRHASQGVRLAMLANALRALPRDRFRHEGRLLAPPLVGHVVDEAVAAIEIAPAGDLDDETAKRNDRTRGRESPRPPARRWKESAT